MADYDTIGGGTQGAVGGALSGAAAGAPLGPIGIGIGALLGGIFGSKKTKVPKPPTYSQILEGALTGQENMQGRFINLEKTYRPEWQNVAETSYLTQLMGDGNNLGYLDLVNRARQASRPYEEAATLDELRTTAKLSPIAREALMSEGQKQMHGMLMSDAMNRLSAGTNLTEQDAYLASQSARRAMAARGLGGRQGVASEVLQNNALGIERRDAAIKAAYDALKTETTFQNMANSAAQSGKDFMGNYGKLFGASNMLGEAEGRVFNPQDALNAQAMGNQYQHGMAVAKAGLAQQQGFFNSLGQFGKFAAANPNMFGSGESEGGGGGPINMNDVDLGLANIRANISTNYGTGSTFSNDFASFGNY